MDKLVRLPTSFIKIGTFCQSLSSRSIFIENKKILVFNTLQDKQRNFLSFSCSKYSTITSEEVDDNDKALQELDITLLKPHPEWRNVATGPVWGTGNEYYELLWKHYLDDPIIQRNKREQDENWDEYVAKFGVSPNEYLHSEDYIKRYQDKVVWFGYIRNKKGFIQPQKTRKNCKRDGVLSSGSPCALCRDDQLLLTYKNVSLLTQFIDHLTGELHNCLRTGLCQTQQNNLVNAFNLAKEYGYFYCNVPFVKYDLKNFKRNSLAL